MSTSNQTTLNKLALARQKKPVKEKKGIERRSSKMKDVMKVLKKLYASFLKTRPFCRIKSPVCTKVATVVHHLKGRTPDLILDETYFCEACPECNVFVESNDAWAREYGFKLSKYN